MKKIAMISLVAILILAGLFFAAPGQNISSAQSKTPKYYDKEHFLIEGIAFIDSVKETSYVRFPLSYKDKVRPAVWGLSRSSAGVSVRFLSNSSSISVKWELLNDTKMNHMAETGIKGVDLYCKVDNKWVYVNTARPTGKENTYPLISNMSVKMREFKMYLPLYDGVKNLEIGIDDLSQIEKPAINDKKPIVFYGTSITQGGCASRPGMVHTSIISRKLNIDCLNFGFSGNGRMEKPVAELISVIDASCYVIECIANMQPAEIHENAIPLIEIIRSRHPRTPVVFVENVMPAKASFEDTTRNRINYKNSALKTEYEKMIKKGLTDIYYIDNNGALGSDNEATVDGVHYTDLGFLRYADFLISRFKKLKLTFK